MAGHTDDTSRQLIHIPLIHAPADMGTMAQGLEAVYVERFGRRRWQEQVALAERFWRAVRRELESLRLDYARVDLYQDGLPVCGKEAQIVRAAAGQGSENHQLLVDLMARGATLVGTEDIRLLLEEYRDVRAAVGRAVRCPPERQDVEERRFSEPAYSAGVGPPALQVVEGTEGRAGRPLPAGQASSNPPVLPAGLPSGTPVRHVELLAQRDAYIGRRIGATLQHGRIGLLLLGMAHAIEPHLPADNVVSRLHFDV
jgi:hypothetical protein